jgi:branched-chain amino acid transport system ATP-binding protein
MLRVSDLNAGYGAIKVLRDVSLQVMPGEIVTLIGANGAGKTTLMKALAGALAPTSGKIEFEGTSIFGLKSHRIVAMGINLVKEGRGILAPMSVEENLMLGGYLRKPAEIATAIDQVYEMFPILAQRRRQPGGTLSGGEQQMRAIGRALVARPRLLMLDEPSLGLAPKVVTQIFQCIDSLRHDSTAILLVEQNARKALKIADRGYVLRSGRIVMEGSGETLLKDPDVFAAYLGTTQHRTEAT